MRPHHHPMRGLAFAAALVTALLLWALTSVVRERLVPYGSDRVRAMWLLTGDEPTYLVTAQALASGHGENILPITLSRSYSNFIDRVNWDEHYATWTYYSYFKPPRILDRSAWWRDKQIIHRPPLFSLLAAPLVFLKSNARWWILACQSVILILAAGGLVFWVGRAKPSPFHGLALLFTWGSLPVLYYSAQLYPEIVSGVLLTGGVVVAARWTRPERFIGYAMLLVALLGTPRIGAGVLACLGVLAGNALFRKRWMDALVIGIGVAVFFGYNLFVWGWFTPPNPDETSPMSWGHVPMGILISLISRDVGLIWLSPVLSAAILAIPLYWRDEENRFEAWAWSALFAGVILVVAAFPNYRAGCCPAGRYQVIPAMLLALPLLRGVGDRSVWARRVRWMMLVWGPVGLMMAWRVGRHPAWWHSPSHPWLNESKLRSVEGWLTSSKYGWTVTGVVLLIVLLMPMLVGWWVDRRQRRSG